MEKNTFPPLFLSFIQLKIGDKEKTFPTGTWFLGLKILSEDLKQKILNKEVRGLSATAMKRGNKVLDFLSFKSKEQIMTTFKELGDYDVIGVSLVEDPSYEDALFFSFKCSIMIFVFFSLAINCIFDVPSAIFPSINEPI